MILSSLRLGAQRLGTAVRSYLGTLRWFSIPASVGFAYICYQQFWHVKEREERRLKSGELVAQWQVTDDCVTFLCCHATYQYIFLEERLILGLRLRLNILSFLFVILA